MPILKKQYLEEYVNNKYITPNEIEEFLINRCKVYNNKKKNIGDISLKKRKYLSSNGQHPYATIITCSDSRVPVEHIFNVGVGELFVIRTAGNVIGDFELGSIEYGVDHLKTKLVLVLGHTNCGAVDAAMNGHAYGYICKIINEIINNVPKNCTCREAEIANVKHSIDSIMKSDIIKEAINKDEVSIRGAIYNIETGLIEMVK